MVFSPLKHCKNEVKLAPSQVAKMAKINAVEYYACIVSYSQCDTTKSIPLFIESSAMIRFTYLHYYHCHPHYLQIPRIQNTTLHVNFLTRRQCSSRSQQIVRSYYMFLPYMYVRRSLCHLSLLIKRWRPLQALQLKLGVRQLLFIDIETFLSQLQWFCLK